MIRRTALALSVAAIAVLAAGCGARTSTIPGAYTEGGVGSPFYAEVPFDDHGKKRIYLFGNIAMYDKFVAHPEKAEVATQAIGKGKNRETLVVPSLPKGWDDKNDPDYAKNLFARYVARNGAPVAVAE